MNVRVLVIVAAVVGGCRSSPPDGPAARVTIPRGAVLASVADTLHARDLVSSPELFRFYATLSGRDRMIQAGAYEIPPGLSIRQLLTILGTGRPAEKRLVIPEGLTVRELAAIVEREIGIPEDSLLAAARDSLVRANLGIPSATLEGYLYPSTYLVRTDASARDVVRQMVGEFERQWRPEWDARLDTLEMTRHEIVTLASIIEGEVRYGPDRPYVSSVYHNRLLRGMPLQADPTVIYALGRRRRLFERDYQIRSPYNTSLIDGLPPGPIGEPSGASIWAALYPARTNLLFLVARPDGQHVFSHSLREHRRAVREVRRLGTSPGRDR